MNKTFFSNANLGSDTENDIDKNQGLNTQLGYAAAALTNWESNKLSLSSDIPIKEYQVDEIQRLRKENGDFKELIAKMKLEISEKNNFSKILHENLPEHIYEVVSIISSRTDSTYSDVISRGLVLLEIALLTKANGGEIIIRDNEGNEVSSIDELE